MVTEDDLNNDYSCNCDNWLFHYTKHDTAIKYILPTLKLKASYFGNMEDPFESASLQHSTWPGTPDDESKYTMHENTVNAYRQFTKVLSFCVSTESQNALLKPRMWSQYGDRHAGICLIFDKAKLCDKIKTEYPAYEVSAQKVQYDSGHSEKIASVLDSKLRDTDDVYSYFKAHSDILLFNKHPDYKDESEFKIAMYSPEAKREDLYIPIEKALLGIVLGYSYCNENVYSLPLVEYYAKRLQCGLFHISFDNGHGLIIVKHSNCMQVI